MKLSDLKVGDKFRWAGETIVYELLCVRVRGSDGAMEWSYWNETDGFYCTAIDSGVELITDPPEPQYRPYSNLERFFLTGFVCKATGELCSLVALSSGRQTGSLAYPDGSLRNTNIIQLFEFYTHLDGTPCGELVSENSN